MIDELGFFSIADIEKEFSPVRAYRAYIIFLSIDWEGPTINASYFSYDWSEGGLRSHPAAELSVARFADGHSGESGMDMAFVRNLL